MSREIFCIGYEEHKEIVADWYVSLDAREPFIGTSEKREVLFSFRVDSQVNDEQISAMAIDLAWFKVNFPVTVGEDEELELQ